MSGDWKEVTIGDITTSCLGKMLDKQKNKGEYQPYLANVNVRWGGFDLSDLPQMRFEDTEQERYGLHYGDIVLCEGGEPGRCAIWKDQIPNMKIQKALHRIRVNESVSNEYLYYWFLWAGKSGLLNSYFTGTTILHLPGEKLKSIRLRIPPYEHQIEVASVLSCLDAKIELNNQINENLQQQAQAIFEERFITSQCKGEQRPLYNFANYINGAAFKTDDFSETGLPIIKIAELKNGITESTQYFSGDKGEKYIVEDKDILFSWSGNPETSIDIFIWSHGKGILNQHTFNVKPLNGRRWFIYLLLKHFKPEFMHIASGKQTTGLGHITAADLKRLTFVWNEQAMDEFENEISPLMELLYNNMIENKELSLLRDSLIDKLID